MCQCQGCQKNVRIVNKFHKLCLECNNLRLYGNKFGKQYKNTLKSKPLLIKPKKRQINKNNKLSHKVKEPIRLTMLEKDELFYEELFNMSDHKCEECSKALPTNFRDEDGKIVARWRYSHIIPKSIAPKLRHSKKNINHLCLEHHSEWENGDKKGMNIYNKNKLRFPNYLD